MKITKRQLRKIIAEEKERLSEGPDIPDVMGAIGGGKFSPRATAMGHTGIQPGDEGRAINYKLEELEEALAGVRNPEDWAERKHRSLPAFLQLVDRVIAVLEKMN